MGFLRRVLERLSESDEERLAETVRDWADGIAGTTRIGDVAHRTRVQVAGVISRLSVVPVAEGNALEAMVTDGTGEVVAQWTGRASIPGVKLGQRILLEGMAREEPSGRRVIVNPGFEFSAAQP